MQPSTAPAPHSYTQRRADLILLLRTLAMVGDPLQRGDSGGRFEPGPRVLTMPAAWHAGSYEKALQALRKLQRHGPRHYWNVHARYISPTRTNRTLIYRASVKRAEQYVEPLDVTAYGDSTTTVVAGEVFDLSHAEVISARTDPRVKVSRRAGEPRGVCVRAIVERWDPRVERRPLELGLDFLLANMPNQIRLPREVRNAA